MKTMMLKTRWHWFYVNIVDNIIKARNRANYEKDIESFHSSVRHNQITFALWLTCARFVIIHSVKWRLLPKFDENKENK